MIHENGFIDYNYELKTNITGMHYNDKFTLDYMHLYTNKF